MKPPNGNGIEGVRAALDEADGLTMPDLDIPDAEQAELRDTYMHNLKREYYSCKLRKAVALAIGKADEVEQFEKLMGDFVQRIMALQGLKVQP